MVQELIERPHPWWNWWILGLSLLVVGAGVGVDLMEVDAAQYASMGQEMNHSGLWVTLHEHGAKYQSRGYPDKPPLVFWAAALGTKVLGATNAGAKLISVLVGLLGIWAIGKWASELLGPGTEWPARIFYGANLGMGLMLMDVRTDTLLVGLVTLTGWQAQVWRRTFTWTSTVTTFGLLGLAMLAKGPLALMALMAVHGGEALWSRDYRLLRNSRLWIGLAVTLAVLMPWLWGLYQQWGWKNGVWYYLWTQNFGRLSGENPWAHKADYTFVLHNLAWTFLPWVIMVPAALRHALTRKQRTQAWSRQVLTAWILLAMGLSLSKFQLPHYVYILWPFQALLLARWWAGRPDYNLWLWATAAIVLVVAGAGTALGDLAFGTFPLGLGLTVAVLAGMYGLWRRTRISGHAWVLVLGASGMLLALLQLHLFFYPKLLHYQGSSQLGLWFREHRPGSQVAAYGCGEESLHALHFYTRSIVPTWTKPSDLRFPTGGSLYVYSNPEAVQGLQQAGYRVSTLREIPTLKVTRLGWKVLNPRLRSGVTGRAGIYRIDP